MKKLIIGIIIIVMLFPLSCLALKNYDDPYGEAIGVEHNKDKINVYILHSEYCPHCKDELSFLNDLTDKYDNVDVYSYEVVKNKDNMIYYEKALDIFKIDTSSVPITIIGKEYYIGFNDIIKYNIEEQVTFISKLSDDSDSDEEYVKSYDLPLIGRVKAVDVSMPLISIILGAIDGFNPCAMWVLLFILNILINLKDKNKMEIMGGLFLLSSGIVYFLSIYGISLVLSFTKIKFIRYGIGLLAIGVSIYSIIDIIRTFKNTGCKVVNDNKRKKILKRVNVILKETSFIAALLGIIALAVSVNLVELACSLGFPAIFGELMAANNITGLTKFLYIILYTLFYMIDDIIVFIIAIKTMDLVGVSNNVTKIIKIIASILMLVMGVLLIFAPNIVMFNF